MEPSSQDRIQRMGADGVLTPGQAGPGLDIYTPETRRRLEGWVMTPAQMDNLVKT